MVAVLVLVGVMLSVTSYLSKWLQSTGEDEALAFTEVLDLYREAGSALTWTFLSPAPEFTDKPRTGTYTEGGDQPAGSEISVADFAVALVDEAEKDAHRGHRWTIANA